MSEHATDLKAWSRPALQRTELGPMMHDFAHKVYDAAEDSALDRLDQVPVPYSIRQLAPFTTRLAEIVLSSAQQSALMIERQTLINYVDGNRYDVNAHNVTTIGGWDLISEGLASGVYVPAHLYRAISVRETQEETQDFDPRESMFTASIQSIQPKKFADRIISPNFLRMLHELSYAPNGHLGSSSTKAHALTGGPLLTCFETAYDQQGRINNFKLDETGTVIGFSLTFLADKQWALRSANKTKAPSFHSGGCPVRHDTFKKIGENAEEYLDGQRPLNEGVSAITRAAQFVSNVLNAKVATL